MFAIALTLHILAVVIWIGGLFFAVVLLAPALATIDDHQRIEIWAKVIAAYIPWIWGSIVVLLATGFLMISLGGGFDAIGIGVYIMLGLTIIMIAIFKFSSVAPFKHLCRGIEEEKWGVATYALGTTRKLAAVNLGLGIIIIISAIIVTGRI